MASAAEDEIGDKVGKLEIDFSKLRDLVVYSENGEIVRVSDIYKKQKTILILIRVRYVRRTLRSIADYYN